MGTSMGDSVLPEGVMGGLKRWRARARRNIARRRRDFAVRSFDASVETSPSFGTVDASPSLDIDYATDDDGIEWAARSDDDNVAEIRAEQPRKLGSSFDGFELSRGI